MAYEPNKIEKKWQGIWDKNLKIEAKDFSKKDKFYALVEFPYPSGAGLHTGHAFNYTLMDIFARKKRMQGYNVLYPMGWDAFGLPTENYAIKTGIHPAEATKKNTENFKKQMKALGTAFNWDREINTTNPDYYKWTQWIFIQFFKNGLAYKKEMDINWCPSCKIGLANEEVIRGNCERCGALAGRKKLAQWLLKITAYADRLDEELDLVDYPDSIKAAQRNWVGRSFGWQINFPVNDAQETIAVFTTRPDTIFGATFFVLAPEHPLALKIASQAKKQEVKEYIRQAKKKKDFERIDETKEKTGVFTGGYVLNPLSSEKIPVFAADFVVMDYGTGAIMGVPAHDPRDWQFAKKMGLPIKRVVSGNRLEQEVYSGKGKLINSKEFNGLDSEKAKQKIFKRLEEKGLAHQSVNYHLRDWIFSRQHYWGEPIPMVYCKSCAQKGIDFWKTNKGLKTKPLFSPPAGLEGWFPLEEKELPLKLPEMKKYKPTGTGQSPLAAVDSWVEVKCPHCGSKARRETDTMPNWAGSSWYYLRYIDPQNSKALAENKKLDYWLPVDFYLGGAEHTTLHLLYSRFWHKFLNDLKLIPGREPYQKRRNRGIILGEDSQKMSKSKGNVINPDQVIAKYGADTLRMYLVFMGPYNNTLPWSTASVQGVRRFLERLYDFIAALSQNKGSKTPKEIETEIHRLIKAVGEDIEEMKYNTAIASMMKFLNKAESEKEISLENLKKIVLILAPFAPYLAEELWQVLGGNFSVHCQNWPDYESKLIQREKIILVVQVNGKVRDKLEVNSGIIKEEAEKKALSSAKTTKWLKGREVKEIIFVQDRLINFVV